MSCIIKINPETNQYEFYNEKIEYLDNGVEVLTYTDAASIFQEAAQRFTNITNLKTEPFVPTEEQTMRLNDVNSIDNKSDLSTYIMYVDELVQFGYIPDTWPEWASHLVKKYEQSSKVYLINKYNNKLSKYKTEKEYTIINYNGFEVSTDLESQSKISSTLLGMISGMISEVNFKFKNGFKVLNKEEFQKMSSFIMGHVQICFTSESSCKERIKNMSLSELKNIKIDETENNMPNASEEKDNKISLRDMFEQTYETIFNTFKASLSGVQITQEQPTTLTEEQRIETIKEIVEEGVTNETMDTTSYTETKTEEVTTEETLAEPSEETTTTTSKRKKKNS